MVDFTDFLDEDDDAILDPREIFMTLSRDKRFAFPRDIQTEVMNAWYRDRDQRNTIIKLNVGSGKTLIGLLLLQSALNEKKGPSLYVCPDNQLVAQVLDEAKLLGLDATDDPRDAGFEANERICVTNIHRVFNGKSIFGVGAEGIKIGIGTIIIDDVHACIAVIANQFRITLPSSHAAYQAIFELVSGDLKAQSAARFLDLESGDPRAFLEVPFWAWQDNADKILAAMHGAKATKELDFSYPLLSEVLKQCRCIVNGQSMEIEPVCPPTSLIRAFSKAERRIYMTATLSDDSVLVSHFGADPVALKAPIVPTSSQSMGERMILMPQDINPDLEAKDIRELLVDLAKTENVVVIVPSTKAAKTWRSDADQVLIGEGVVDGVNKLREGHVGLTVLINRYDGIDLPDGACRVLAILDLPEVSSFVGASDMAVLSNSDAALRRQMQRIEQGMGRGVRSNDDYCVVLLCGPKLTRRIKSPQGQAMLTGATRVQMDLTAKLTKKLAGGSLEDIKGVIRQCLDRDVNWVAVSKKALLKAKSDDGLTLEPSAIAVRQAFDSVQMDDPVAAAAIMRGAINDTQDEDLKAWLKVRLAEVTHPVDAAEAQKILLSAHKSNHSVLRPIKGVAYQKLKPLAGQQAAAVQEYHRARFLDATQRVLFVKDVLYDLEFDPDRTDEFESAIDALGLLIGLSVQRPERQFKKGPDNLWAFAGPNFFVIECKSGATSVNGIAKKDLGQLAQSMSWFEERYVGVVSATPIMVHALAHAGPGATPVQGMRIITPKKLLELKDALNAFCSSLGDQNILNDVARIGALITTHSLSSDAFLSRYTVRAKAAPKSKRKKTV